MAIAYDIKLNETGDLLFKNGDIIIDASDEQHIQDTINAFPGWWKEFPADGVGILSYLKSSGKQQELAREIILQLQTDGYTVTNPTVIISTDNISINPNAIRI
ncbi:MAG TPA: hypothetical protein VHA52_11350 [Candidatus Babeliaceae bacterium]|nr:hypothetical protein [Candidatus Babeliaceae bacterium]